MADDLEVQGEYGTGDWIDDFGIPRTKRWSKPKLPHPETGKITSYVRVSTIAKILDDTYNLELWKQKMVARGVASRRDLTNRAATTDLDERYAWIDICETAMDYAGASEGRNNGTALHDLAQIYDRDPANFEPTRYPEELLADLYAYQDALKVAKISMVQDMMERATVNIKAGIAGTWDRVASSPLWELPRIADLKTQKTIDYSQASIAIQVAAYAYGNVLLPKPWPGYEGTINDYLPMPALDLQKGILIHVPAGKAECHIYEIDLEAGHNALMTALSVRRWRSRKDLFTPVPTEVDMPSTDDLGGRADPVRRQPPTPVGGAIPTARHKPAPKEQPVKGIVTVTLDQLAGVAGDDDKMRDHIRNAIRLVKDKETLAAMFTQYEDLWTDDMTELGIDTLRALKGLQPIGPPF